MKGRFNNMKATKILALVLGAMLLSALAISAVSCESADNENTTTTTTVSTTTTTTTYKPDTTPDTPSKITYKVTVKDADGNPVEGVSIQRCLDELCKLPVSTNAEGIVTFDEEKNDWQVKVSSVPEGYAEDKTVYTFEGDSTELVITLTKAA